MTETSKTVFSASQQQPPAEVNSAPLPPDLTPSQPQSPPSIPPVPPPPQSRKWLIVGLVIVLIIVGLVVSQAFNASPKTSKSTNYDISKAPDSEAPLNPTSYRRSTPTPTETDAVGSLPTPPTGFTWYGCRNMASYFLKPDGWHVLEESGNSGQTEACFITKEEIVGDSEFETGLSVNYVKNVPAATGKTVDEYAESFLELMVEKYNAEPVAKKSTPEQNIYSTSFEIDDENGHIMTHYTAITFPAEEAFYLAIFESPYELWDEEWPQYGETIMKQLVITR